MHLHDNGCAAKIAVHVLGISSCHFILDLEANMVLPIITAKAIGTWNQSCLQTGDRARCGVNTTHESAVLTL